MLYSNDNKYKNKSLFIQNWLNKEIYLVSQLLNYKDTYICCPTYVALKSKHFVIKVLGHKYRLCALYDLNCHICMFSVFFLCILIVNK